MANGQAVLSSMVLDVAEVDRLTDRMERREIDRHIAHAEQLADALALDEVYRAAGMALMTSAVIALTTRSSEHRAAAQLHEAQTLHRLGALAAMRAGLLTVEQGRVVIDVLGAVDKPEVADEVWARLLRRLEQDARIGAVLPPARTAELLRRWLMEADRDGVIDRRKQAEQDSADVDLWKREDGLVDIAIRGVTGTNAQAAAQRIQEHADPIGTSDNRPVGMRYRDAAIDLILGRTTLPFSTEALAGAAEIGLAVPGRCGRPICGCSQGQAVPCGVDVQVLVPIGSALGTADEPAELVGHGPIDAGLLAQLLLTAPVLTRVWVDPDTGVPVAVDDRIWIPPRGDPDALRAALLDIASGDPPPERIPMHPDDHPPPGSSRPPVRRLAPPLLPRRSSTEDERVLAQAALGSPEVLDHAHPANTSGPYVVPRRLRRLLLVRSPRCEWPGCGRRAQTAGAGCDVDHDLAWPDGPTCGCNTGPLCRRHHRIKQLGWTKQRRIGGHVRWTSPFGRGWLSRAQHQPPPVAARPLPPLPKPDPLAGLTDAELVEVLWHSDPTHPIFDSCRSSLGPDDIDPFDIDPFDIDPPDIDTVGERYQYGDLWVLLNDYSAWNPDPPAEDLSQGW